MRRSSATRAFRQEPIQSNHGLRSAFESPRLHAPDPRIFRLSAKISRTGLHLLRRYRSVRIEHAQNRRQHFRRQLRPALGQLGNGHGPRDNTAVLSGRPLTPFRPRLVRILENSALQAVPLGAKRNRFRSLEPLREGSGMAYRLGNLASHPPGPKPCFGNHTIGRIPFAKAVLLVGTDDRGQPAWRYGLRALGETAMAHVKRLNGGKLTARTFQSQQTEIAMQIDAINRSIRAAKPNTIRIR